MYAILPHTWHSDTIKRFKGLSVEELEFIRADAKEAAEKGEEFDNPKVGQYWDEYHYACMELHRRKIQDLEKRIEARENAEHREMCGDETETMGNENMPLNWM